MAKRLIPAACAVSMLAVSLLAVPSASAGPKLPVGKADGVRVVAGRDLVVVIFTSEADRLRKEIAGKRVAVGCTALPNRRGSSSRGWQTLRAPVRGRVLRMSMLMDRRDYCRAWRTGFQAEDPQFRERFLIASVPLTQRGAAYLAEEKAVRELAVMLWYGWPVVGQESKGYATPEAFLRRLRRLSPRADAHVVALTAPDETPPSGEVGYYSDGAGHAATVTVAATGRRLFIEVRPDRVVETNVMGFLVAEEIIPPVPVTPRWPVAIGAALPVSRSRTGHSYVLR